MWITNSIKTKNKSKQAMKLTAIKKGDFKHE